MEREVSALLEDFPAVQQRAREAVDDALHVVDEEIVDEAVLIEQRLLRLGQFLL